MSDRLNQLVAGDAVFERSLQMKWQLVRAVPRHQGVAFAGKAECRRENRRKPQAPSAQLMNRAWLLVLSSTIEAMPRAATPAAECQP